MLRDKKKREYEGKEGTGKWGGVEKRGGLCMSIYRVEDKK